MFVQSWPMIWLLIDYYGVTFDHLVPANDPDPDVLQINIIELETASGPFANGEAYANRYLRFAVHLADYAGKKTRTADCRLTWANYQLYYPFEEQCQAQYSYRVDKARGRFVTVGVALPSDDEDEESQDEESQDEESQDEEIEGHNKMIEFLHEKGGDLNNADRRGRTPLMEATLWGRLKVVDFLLEHGADPCAKDRKGRGAYFYARPSRSTARMREKFRLCQESREAEANRRIIAIKLQAFEPVPVAEEEARSGLSNQPKRGHFVTTASCLSRNVRAVLGVSFTVEHC
ncbi:hypothetical protein C8A01DRAFT_33908 [Parachaetomium inaequale]|uniref:Uncharacterized protein n=1 Tax=Parachaetomium inaequale TaxID=2588326 RepID=A0AAN6STI3_9PEZI|nr:hypothetical protein C8A01DRAFT_33908 [Parachaetomium inaequale]